jgi:glyoxylase-like metal-dependent hydrolase (beta-lactamase superfamily II)
MIVSTQHGDVTELRLSWWRSRASSLAVSVFVSDGVMIDSGFPRSASALGDWLATNHIEGAIITHAHEDHAGGVTMLASRGIPVACAPDSEALMRAEERVGLYRQFCWGSRERLSVPVQPFASTRFELRPARGHSPDHHVVWDRETGTVFCGDLYIGKQVRVAHHNEDVRQQIATLREVASWNPTRVFDAHRGLLPDPVWTLQAKANWMEQTIAEIERLAHLGWTDRRIRDHVLGPEDTLGRVSFGDYSRLNFVRNVLSGSGIPAEATTQARSA